ncbi:uncharacterized protein LOC123509258 [Portunus trituberculatus]|uniref:uncharacterized protein LOC123509258 n=1 Tax=Portunus trituberculatus TaxID=210409 RepID=UPI001E1CDE1F|nr:uncharacterized protein LOC123509258 [Portunus trituberculatus]
MSGARLLLLCLAALALTSSAGVAKTLEADVDDITSSSLKASARSFLKQLLQEGSDMSLSSVAKALSEEGVFARQVKGLLKKRLPNLKEVAGGLGVTPDLLQHFLKLARKVRRMGQHTPVTEKAGAQAVLETVLDYLGGDEEEEEGERKGEEASEDGSEAIQGQLLHLAKGMFEQRFGNLSSIKASANATQAARAGLWEVVRSTWARVLSYVEEQNSLESFLQRTPVRIIDRALSLGDDLNLASFLAKKLDPEFAAFLAARAEPLLGPLRDADSLANLTQVAGLGTALDYFTSERFANTVAAMSRFVSAYLEDSVSEDVVSQYIDFISFNNPELNHFYRSVLNTTQDAANTTQEAAAPQRRRRDVLRDIASIYRYENEAARHEPDQSPADTTDPSSRQMQHRYGVSSLGAASALYDPSRDGYGYGGGGGYGGGYGGYGMNMNTLDPYVVLGSLALGTILGFLLFRALRGTGGGRRDIGDGSLSLWQSDQPFGGGNRALRAERAAPPGREGLALPASLRGDVWSSAPLVDDETSTGLPLDEDDVANHLNQLWRAHRGNDSSTCVRSRLCSQLTGSGATHAGLALLLSSTGSLLGVARPGQLVDDVAGSLAVGSTYSCPSVACSAI